MSEENTAEQQQQKAKEGFEVTFKGKKYKFFLRTISILEEKRLRQKFSALNEIEGDAEKTRKNHSINVEALAEYSDDFPILPDLQPDHWGTPLAMIRHWFEKDDAEKERVAEYVIVKFLDSLVPSVDFK